MRVKDVPELTRVSVPEKILFVEELWDSISPAESDIPVQESHENELDKRFEKHLKSPGELLSLSELQAHIEKRK